MSDIFFSLLQQVSDQGASLFGVCRFRKGDVKITLGTGSFLNVNTGNEAHASINGKLMKYFWNFSVLFHIPCYRDANNCSGIVLCSYTSFSFKMSSYQNLSCHDNLYFSKAS